MERIAIAGLTLHETDVRGLERLARPDPAGEARFLRELADEVAASEAVYLATCNRVEFVYAREVGHLPTLGDLTAVARALGLREGDELRQRMHLYAGRDAARHLFRVASSLDSLVVGEDQILAQVREAFARAELCGLRGPLLGPLFEHAFQVGKQVRTRTGLSRHPVSVVSIGLSHIAQSFACDGPPPRLAVVGAGRMGELAARAARDLGIEVAVFVNRSPERAQALAKEFGASSLDLETFRSGVEKVDCLVSATSAPGFVLDAATLSRLAASAPLGRPLVAVDLALPRDLEPTDDSRVVQVDLERLRETAEINRGQRAQAAQRGEELVEQKLDVLARQLAARGLSATLEDLHRDSADVLERELAHLFEGRLADLGNNERHAVERWARTTFGRLSHVPIAALKRYAEQRDGIDGAHNEGLAEETA